MYYKETSREAFQEKEVLCQVKVQSPIVYIHGLECIRIYSNYDEKPKDTISFDISMQDVDLI